MHFIKSLNKLQKICIVAFGFAFLIFIAAGFWLLKDNLSNKKAGNTTEGSDALADEMDYYPDNISLGEQFDLTLYDKDGNASKLSDYRGQNVIVLYWSSWCKYCNEEFSLMGEYMNLLSKYDDVKLILLNKMDGKKETLEKAEGYLEKNGEGLPNYYDFDLDIFNQLGMKVIPDIFGIDKNGVLKLWYPDNLKSIDQLAAMIDYIRLGGSYATEKFVTGKLTGKDGGIYTNYQDTGQASPSGDDVLCESQGIIMEYAVKKQNQKLFDQSLNYLLNHMMNDDGLAAWVVTDAKAEHPERSGVNSLIDDLRIYDALYKADQLWGNYDSLLVKWRTAILKYNTQNNKFVDFYNADTGEKANRLTLCFADLSAMRELQAEGEESELLANTGEILEEGYISDDFPLYYSWYDYGSKKYSKDDLNMAEEMVTLFNLAKADKLKQQTIDWLKDAMANGGIKARYTCDGEVVKNYNYSSTAVYAILVMLAKEIGDQDLMTEALARMELMRVNDQSLEFNGSFGKGDGTDIYSYDQCMALLAYAYEEDR